MIMGKNLGKIFKENYTGEKDSLQKCLFELKKIGCTQIEAVKVLMDELQISLREADKIVLTSNAWEQEKDSTLNLRDNFEKGLSD
jgi:hypothetical protein